MYNIAIVDDEYLSREFVKSVIKEIVNVDISIQEFKNGIEAKNMIETYDFDIIFMDINIPGINGIDLCRNIKNKDEDAKIVIITGCDDLGLRNKIINLNIDRYMIKPVRPEHIKNYLEKVFIKNKNYLTNSQLDLGRNIDIADHKNLNSEEECLYGNYINDIIKYIEDNINKNITLEDVSRYVNISPHYLSKIFKRETGVNFITYLTNKRIEMAKIMLEDVNIPISNIAIDLSYSKSNYFSKVFKKNVGLTPSEYRESLSNDQ